MTKYEKKIMESDESEHGYRGNFVNQRAVKEWNHRPTNWEKSRTVQICNAQYRGHSGARIGVRKGCGRDKMSQSLDILIRALHGPPRINSQVQVLYTGTGTKWIMNNEWIIRYCYCIVRIVMLLLMSNSSYYWEIIFCVKPTVPVPVCKRNVNTDPDPHYSL